MRKTIITPLVALLVLATSIKLIAWQESQIIEGSRVRESSPIYVTTKVFLKLKKDARFVGTVVRLDPDSLVIKAEGWSVPIAFPFASPKKLEVSRSRKKISTAKSACLGSIVGVIAGGLIRGASPECSTQQGDPHYDSECEAELRQHTALHWATCSAV